MRRIDWERDPSGSPFDPDTAGEALVRKLQNQIVFDRGLLKNYGYTIISILFLVAINAWWRFEYSPMGWTRGGVWQQLAVTGMLIVFFFTRIHLSAVPALSLCQDAKTTLWENFRKAFLTGDELTKALILHSFYTSAAPMAVLCLFETLFYLSAMGAGLTAGQLLAQGFLILLIYAALGMLLNAFGFIGALIWKNTYVVVIAILLPMIVGIFIAGSDYFIWFMQGFLAEIHQSFQRNWVTIFLAPENQIAFSGAEFTRQGTTSVPATDPVFMFLTFLLLAVACGLVWGLLWIFLRWRLRY